MLRRPEAPGKWKEKREETFPGFFATGLYVPEFAFDHDSDPGAQCIRLFHGMCGEDGTALVLIEREEDIVYYNNYYGSIGTIVRTCVIRLLLTKSFGQVRIS